MMRYFKWMVHATHLAAHTTTSDSTPMMNIATCVMSTPDQTPMETNVSLICALTIKFKPEMDIVKFAHHTTQPNKMRRMEISNISASNNSAMVTRS